MNSAWQQTHSGFKQNMSAENQKLCTTDVFFRPIVALCEAGDIT
jgi:hypothetical protein